MSCDWLFVDGSSLIFRAFYHLLPVVVSVVGSLPALRGEVEALTFGRGAGEGSVSKVASAPVLRSCVPCSTTSR